MRNFVKPGTFPHGTFPRGPRRHPEARRAPRPRQHAPITEVVATTLS